MSGNKWPINNPSYAGNMSAPGAQGPEGEAGADATIAIGSVAAVPYGTPPTVENVGTPGAAVFDFELETGAPGADGANGTDGDDAYVYIAYASDASGAAFTLTFNAALDYIAVKHTTVAIASPIASDFTGLWKNYKGATGADGADGVDGADGISGSLFVVDENGALMPSTASPEEAYYELDGDDNIMPLAA